MTDYVEVAATGVVHVAGCRRLSRTKPEDQIPWRREKQHLLPGRRPCPACRPYEEDT